MKTVGICALAMLGFVGLGQAAMYEGFPHLAIVLWSLALLAIGLSFYRLRMRSRLWYGGFEILFALAGSYFVLLNLYANAQALTLEIVFSRMVLLFAAVYVMVGALSNIGEALTHAGRLKKKWDRVFRN